MSAEICLSVCVGVNIHQCVCVCMGVNTHDMSSVGLRRGWVFSPWGGRGVF